MFTVVYCDLRTNRQSQGRKLSAVGKYSRLFGEEPTVRSAPVSGMKVSKKDGINPVDNRLSTNKLHHFVQKKREKKVAFDA